jgi:hypothetical protein
VCRGFEECIRMDSCCGFDPAPRIRCAVRMALHYHAAAGCELVLYRCPGGPGIVGLLRPVVFPGLWCFSPGARFSGPGRVQRNNARRWVGNSPGPGWPCCAARPAGWWSGSEADVGDVGVGAPVGVQLGDDVVPDAVQGVEVAGDQGVDRGVPDVADL